MSSAFRAIAQAIVAQLLAAPALADGHVSLPLRRPVPPEWASHIEVRCGLAGGAEPFVGGGNSPRMWQTQVAVDIYARASAGGSPEADLDALLEAVDARIRTLNLGALGVSQVGPDVQLEWDWQDGATPQELVTYQFTVRHDTRNGLQP